MSLLNLIKKDNNLRRIFGERELKIIEKQLNGVRLSPSEKTRLSRDIRKKFEAIKSLAPYIGEFELKHGKNTKDLINLAIEIIKEHQWFWKIKEIILFGSLAKREFHLFSDIDLAIKFKENINEKEATEFRINILGLLPERVDIQVYNTLPDKIKKEIDKYGKTVYKRGN